MVASKYLHSETLSKRGKKNSSSLLGNSADWNQPAKIRTANFG